VQAARPPQMKPSAVESLGSALDGGVTIAADEAGGAAAMVPETLGARVGGLKGGSGTEERGTRLEGVLA
jgi:hypothetical protein